MAQLGPRWCEWSRSSVRDGKGRGTVQHNETNVVVQFGVRR